MVIVHNAMLHWLKHSSQSVLSNWRKNTMAGKVNMRVSQKILGRLHKHLFQHTRYIYAKWRIAARTQRKCFHSQSEVTMLHVAQRIITSGKMMTPVTAIWSMNVNMKVWKREADLRRAGILMRAAACRLIQAIQKRMFMVFVKERVKLWDKRHDKWIADLAAQAARKKEAIRMLRAMLHKWDMNSCASKITQWKSNLQSEERFYMGLTMISKIMDNWTKQVYKAVMLSWKAKQKIALNKQKLKQKKQEAQEQMATTTAAVKAEVTKLVKDKDKELKAMEETANIEIRRLEKEIKSLEDENNSLRRKIMRIDPILGGGGASEKKSSKESASAAQAGKPPKSREGKRR